jgi:hypothetical protein
LPGPDAPVGSQRSKGERTASEKLNAGEAKSSPQLPTAERVRTVTGKMTKSPPEWIVLNPETLRIRQARLYFAAAPRPIVNQQKLVGFDDAGRG